MLTIRPANERGHAQLDWLDSQHSFSFADYYDPKHMGFRALRVINEDRVAPQRGFGAHPHRDMEIVSYVLSGALAHRDSMGNGSVIRPGDVQRMSAGTGVRHSEHNPSADEAAHFLQIWMLPGQAGLPPSYEQKTFSEDQRRSQLRLIASPDGAAGSVTIHSDVKLYAGLLAGGERVSLALSPGRHAWVQVARGSVQLQGQTLRTGDGAAVSDESELRIEGATGADERAEVLVFDLA